MPMLVQLPELGIEPGRVSARLVSVGEQVYEGDRIAEVCIPGCVIDIPAPAAGRIIGWSVRPGDFVRTGDCLATLEPEE
jgi:pyruvate/2-oxoglutarate dehydrogenase complex dihydrolipoamide acyltransferase (E2) component